MNAAFEQILFQLTGKSNLEAVKGEELRQLTGRYPYFSIGHLLYAQKLKQDQHPDFTTQLQRTAIHFNNPLWLSYLLETKAATDLRYDDEAEVIQPPAEGQLKPDEGHTLSTGFENPVMNNQPEQTIVAAADEEQYAASTTEEAVQQAEDEEKQKEVIASVLEDQLAEFRKPVSADAELRIETEPYHTVDYFASQGIKVDLTQPQDRLGSQLRKFTDWLKQMKNVKPESADLGTDPEVENMIQGIAKSSNETKEIVTETMADVLVKQGKTDKAIQLYIKLSFLNPDKSAYFAAKIEQLKGILYDYCVPGSDRPGLRDPRVHRAGTKSKRWRTCR